MIGYQATYGLALGDFFTFGGVKVFLRRVLMAFLAASFGHILWHLHNAYCRGILGSFIVIFRGPQ